MTNLYERATYARAKVSFHPAAEKNPNAGPARWETTIESGDPVFGNQVFSDRMTTDPKQLFAANQSEPITLSITVAAAPVVKLMRGKVATTFNATCSANGILRGSVGGTGGFDILLLLVQIQPIL